MTAFFATLAFSITHAEPINVTTIMLTDVLETPVYSAPASVLARNAPQIATEISARVNAITVEVGDQVKAGAPLIELDCRRFESALEAAKAELKRARAQHRFADRQLARARNLKQSKNISEELLDQRRTDLAVIDAELAALEETARQTGLDVEHCTLVSPFDAVVTERLISVGDYATQGTALLELIETEGQDVKVELRHEQIESFLTAGEHTLNSNGNSFPLVLRALLPAADVITRTREARLEFSTEVALPGTAGRVVWNGIDRLLPPSYLLRRAGKLGVFAAEQGSARFIPIPNAQEGRPVKVELPLELQLIADGRQRLADDDAINIAVPEPPTQ